MVEIKMIHFICFLGKSIPVGELYFDMSKLHTHLESVGKVGKQGAKKLQRYVKYPIFACNRVLFLLRNEGCYVAEILQLFQLCR